MGNESKQDNTRKIGARLLSAEEVELIVPTYSKIKAQVRLIRSDNANKSDKNSKPDPSDALQKTNNIGILGARGTGKTSVIKTLMYDLKTDNESDKKKKNIILPLVVPENMSESINLMATVLGLFKKEIAPIQSKHSKEHLECWEQKTHGVLKIYDELIKRYCYIQSE